MKKLSYIKSATLLAGLIIPTVIDEEVEKNQPGNAALRSLYLKNANRRKQSLSGNPFLIKKKRLQKKKPSNLLGVTNSENKYNYRNGDLRLNDIHWDELDISGSNTSMLLDNFHLHEFRFLKYDAILNFYRIKRIQKSRRPKSKRFLKRKLYRYYNYFFGALFFLFPFL